MSGMTPQEARDDLDWARAVARSEAGGGDWEDVLDCLVLAMETIAADQIEYGVHYLVDGWGTSWGIDLDACNRIVRNLKAAGRDGNIVARRVSTPWEVTE